MSSLSIGYDTKWKRRCRNEDMGHTVTVQLHLQLFKMPHKILKKLKSSFREEFIPNTSEV